MVLVACLFVSSLLDCCVSDTSMSLFAPWVSLCCRRWDRSSSNITHPHLSPDHDAIKTGDGRPDGFFVASQDHAVRAQVALGQVNDSASASVPRFFDMWPSQTRHFFVVCHIGFLHPRALATLEVRVICQVTSLRKRRCFGTQVDGRRLGGECFVRAAWETRASDYYTATARAPRLKA